MERVVCIAGHLIAACVGVLLLTAAIAKAREPHEVTQALAWAFGSSVAKFGVVSLIVVESLLGAALMLGIAPLKVRFAAVAMFIVFAIWGLAMWVGDAPVSCGCGLKFLPSFSRVEPLAVFVRALLGFALCLLAAGAARFELHRKSRQEIDCENSSEAVGTAL
jgi:uncharacterized membrane protein YphA (DoxX/SURF4 family)